MDDGNRYNCCWPGPRPYPPIDDWPYPPRDDWPRPRPYPPIDHWPSPW